MKSYIVKSKEEMLATLVDKYFVSSAGALKQERLEQVEEFLKEGDVIRADELEQMKQVFYTFSGVT